MNNEIQRDTFWMIPSSHIIIFYVLAAIAMVVFFYGFYRRFRLWKQGRKEKVRWDDVKTNFKFFFQMAVKQKKIQKDKLFGLMHRLISYGFVILFIGTCLVFIDADLGIPILQGRFYLIYEAVLDVFGVLFIFGLLIGISVRARKKRNRLNSSLMDQAFLLLFLLIGIGGYIIEGIRIGETQINHGIWSPVGYALSLMFKNVRLFSLEAYPFWWFSHSIFAFLLIAIIPYTKLFHFLTAPINILFQPVKRTGKVSLPYNSNYYPQEVLFELPNVQGVNKISDFTSWQLLSSDACTECGRCDSQCPAHNSGTPLSPRSIVTKIRDNMKPEQEIASFIKPEELQSCTTCGACVEACPVSINHIDLILSMRRGLIHNRVIESGTENTLLKLEENYNAWGQPWSERANWSRGLNVRTLDKGSSERNEKIEGA